MKKYVIAGTVLTALMAMSPMQVMATDATASATAEQCDILVDGAFPVKKLEMMGEVKDIENPVMPQQARVIDGKVAFSTMQVAGMPNPQGAFMYFSTHVQGTAKTMDATDTAAFRAHPLFRFLEDFGNEEMKLLGPDLSAPNPFLESSIDAETPSQDQVDVTNMKINELAGMMAELIGEDQESIMQKLGQLDLKGVTEDLGRKFRNVASQYKITRQMFDPLMQRKDFLIDIQNLFVGNLEQFEKDIVFIDEIQARFRLAQESLENLAQQGEQILQMEAAVLAQIQDEYTREKVKKAFTRFHQRVTDLRSGVAIAETYINVWETIKDTHYDLIAGIKRALYYNVGIIGAQQMLDEALERQANTQAAIQSMDHYADAMQRQIMEKLGKQAAEQQQYQYERIEQTEESLGEMAVATVAIVQSWAQHDQRVRERLEESRGVLVEIAEQARQARLSTEAFEADEVLDQQD